MERKGIYRKGSAGHVRNINMYRLYRQNYKKWRLPITALLVLTLVLGTAPTVGDRFQTSLLTAGEIKTLETLPREEAYKSVLNILRSFIDKCEKYRMKECVDKGNLLATDLVSVKTDLKTAISAIDKYIYLFEAKVGRKSCVYDLNKGLIGAKNAKKALTDFLDSYGDVIESGLLVEQKAKLTSVIEAVDLFVDSCTES